MSSFLGIAARMYHDEHPRPHFHAYYGEYSAAIAIDSLEVLEGELAAPS